MKLLSFSATTAAFLLQVQTMHAMVTSRTTRVTGSVISTLAEVALKLRLSKNRYGDLIKFFVLQRFLALQHHLSYALLLSSLHFVNPIGLEFIQCDDINEKRTC